MRISLMPILIFTIILLLAGADWAQNKRGPSTPEERDTAVKAAHLLETDPFHKDAKKIRQWFTVWLIEVPDIHIELCGAYLGPVLGSNKNYSSEIFSQMMFSSAAYMIEHPDQANDQVAVNLAGLEGALKAYQSILKVKPKARWEFLDDLIARQDKGDLRAYVQEIAQNKCKAKE